MCDWVSSRLAQYLPVAMTWVTLINIPWVHMVPLFLKSSATLIKCAPSARLTEQRYAVNRRALNSASAQRCAPWLVILTSFLCCNHFFFVGLFKMRTLTSIVYKSVWLVILWWFKCRAKKSSYWQIIFIKKPQKNWCFTDIKSNDTWPFPHTVIVT